MSMYSLRVRNRLRAVLHPNRQRESRVVVEAMSGGREGLTPHRGVLVVSYHLSN